VLAKEARCDVCDSVIEAGDDAYLPQGPPPPVRIVCDECHEKTVGSEVKKQEFLWERKD